MTENPNNFFKLKSKDGDFVTFGENDKGKIISARIIGNTHSTIIKNVLLVNGLKHNLLSITQLCDKGYIVIFKSSKCVVKHESSIIFVGQKHENIYIVDLNDLLANVYLLLMKIVEFGIRN